MSEIVKEYSNGEITVVWKPRTCIHSENCFKGLPAVFDPKEKPWVNIEGASSATIMDQVDKCPSGALSYYKNNQSNTSAEKTDAFVKVETIENGPLMVHGSLHIKEHNGKETEKDKVTAFCRCGASANKPFCDGSHKKIDFKA